MEGLDVPLGVVPKALPCRGEEAIKEDGRMSTDLLLIHV